MSATPISTPQLAVLAEHLAGDVVTPDQPAYDEARRAWNLAADQHPVAVVSPESSEDVLTVVRFAGEHDLRVAPQGTGHNATARGSVDGAILLRTDRMRGLGVDVERRVCRAEAGVLWLEVQEAVSPHGLTALCGSSPDVGVVGYTLGGGISWMARKLGLASDSVTAIELVTGDGRFVRASADEHADLFWALRGGSGSYGVVTAIEFALYPVPALHGGAMLWPWERAREVLQAWLRWTRTAPEEVTTSARILQLPPIEDIPEPLRGRAWVVIDGAIIGDEQFAAEVLEPLRALEPEMDMWAAMPPVALSRIHMDPEEPMPGMSDHVMLRDLDAEAMDRLVDVTGPESGSSLMMVELRHLGGALGRRSKGCGALGALDGEFLTFAGSLALPELVPGFERDTAAIRDAVAPHTTGGFYLNFEEKPSDIRDAFPIDVMSRLRRVKAAYDSGDVVLANHAVKPLRD